MTIDTQKLALQALAGHGHVKPRPDGVRARCGGPAICRVCQQEKAQLEMSQRMDQAFHPLDGQHINQGSVDAAADAYEREYLRDLMDKALGRAYSMGQTYWMQADSESHSQNRRSDETQAKFDVMRAETMAKLCAALGHIDAQAAEIARLREAQAWQSIETAPRDGTDIMLSDGEHVTVGHWYHEEGGITEHRDLDGRWVGQDESDGFDGWIDWIGGITPTHWTQLPAAPGVPQETSHGR